MIRKIIDMFRSMSKPKPHDDTLRAGQDDRYHIMAGSYATAMRNTMH